MLVAEPEAVERYGRLRQTTAGDDDEARIEALRGDGVRGAPRHRHDDRPRAARPHRRRPLGHRHPGHAVRRRARRRPAAAGPARPRPVHPQQGPLRRPRSTPRSPTAASSRARSSRRSWRRCRCSTAIPTARRCPGVETNTGPLGHGFPVAVGCALAARLRGASWRTFVVLGDGELQEGSNWEAAMTAAHYEPRLAHRGRRPQPPPAGRAHGGDQAARAARRQVAQLRLGGARRRRARPRGAAGGVRARRPPASRSP